MSGLRDLRRGTGGPCSSRFQRSKNGRRFHHRELRHQRLGSRLELDHQFLVGHTVTVADLVCAYTLDWANEVGLLDGCPQLLGYLERMYARPPAPLR